MDTYATVEDVRNRGVASSAADNAAVTIALERASLSIDTFCQRDFWLHERTYKEDGKGTTTLFLADRPIIEVTSLKIDDVSVDENFFEVYEDAGYIRLTGGYPSSFPRAYAGAFPEGAKNVEVVGRFGYAEVPRVVKEGCILLSFDFLRKAQSEADVTSATGASSLLDAGNIKKLKIDELSIEFASAGAAAQRASAKERTSGNIEVDRLLYPFRRDLEVRSV